MAVTAADIPTIVSIATDLSQDINRLQQFADFLNVLAKNNFVQPIAGGVESATLTNQQKQNLLTEYNNIRTTLQGHAALLPS